MTSQVVCQYGMIKKDAQKKKPSIDGFLIGFIRQLRQNNGGKYQYAAQQFPTGQRLPQNDPTGKRGNRRFQTHNERCNGWIHALLTNDLQRIGYA